ncbi:beta-phosphoglucomutase [Cytophagaceae bacterium 50C-KIRBA]|uniref:Beta-phosphoglucomutase n=1 Tax=Aquirufa beregesia TaxID=2516556 RepID=A0ABX0ES46_9BACT|nr:beta-phosphoglucomutase [Aquirufa beregesia]NGZ43211.1 beta-phosphoglucomutase [Aquirufa beregesia]
MTYKACLFDLDGVLVDTAIYHFQAWRTLGKQFDFELSHEQNEGLKGISRVESLEKILHWAHYQATQEQKERWLKEKNDTYLELISHMNPSEILPGVISFLSQLKEQGYLIALGSASKNARIILEKTGLITWFNAIIDGNLVTKSKPDPEVFLKGAAALHCQASDCIVFEDAQAGIDAAKAGGMKVIGIGSQKVLQGADKVISSFTDLQVSELLHL